MFSFKESDLFRASFIKIGNCQPKIAEIFGCYTTNRLLQTYVVVFLLPILMTKLVTVFDTNGKLILPFCQAETFTIIQNALNCCALVVNSINDGIPPPVGRISVC